MPDKNCLFILITVFLFRILAWTMNGSSLKENIIVIFAGLRQRNNEMPRRNGSYYISAVFFPVHVEKTTTTTLFSCLYSHGGQTMLSNWQGRKRRGRRIAWHLQVPPSLVTLRPAWKQRTLPAQRCISRRMIKGCRMLGYEPPPTCLWWHGLAIVWIGSS